MAMDGMWMYKMWVATQQEGKQRAQQQAMSLAQQGQQHASVCLGNWAVNNDELIYEHIANRLRPKESSFSQFYRELKQEINEWLGIR